MVAFAARLGAFGRGGAIQIALSVNAETEAHEHGQDEARTGLVYSTASGVYFAATLSGMADE